MAEGLRALLSRRERPARSRAVAGAALLGLVAAACGEDAPTTVPPAAADLRTAEEIADALLERCHGARRGSFDRCTVEVELAAYPAKTVVTAELPHRARLRLGDGRSAVLSDDAVHAWDAESRPHPADAETESTVRTIAALLTAAWLLPLEQRTAVARPAPDRLHVSSPLGECDLRFDPRTLQPVELARADMTIEFLEFYDSGRTLIPVRLRCAPLGDVALTLLETDVEFEDDVFEPSRSVGRPEAATPPAEFREMPRRWWWMVPDPGDWAGRIASMHAIGQELGQRGFVNGGDPLLVEEQDTTWFVVQFTAPPDATAKIPEPDRPDRVREVPAELLAVVAAEPGEWQARTTAAREHLDAWLRGGAATAAGPVRTLLNVVFKDPVADPDVLRTALVELAVPVRRR